MLPYEKRKYIRHRVSLATVNRQMAPCELLVCDRDFLLENLPKGFRARQKVKDHYRKVWMEAMNSEKIPFKRQNAGRRAANTWLRENMWNIYPFI